eukprot:6407575-Prymnesium_polylepis.1
MASPGSRSSPPLERDCDLTVDIGRPLFEVCWRRIHDSRELEGMPATWVYAHTHGLPEIRRQFLRLLRPRQGAQVDEHVVALAQVTPRLNVSDLEQPRPDVVQFLGEVLRPVVVRATIHVDGTVALGKLEARGALQVDVTHLRLGQQTPAHEEHCVILERRDTRPFERWLLEDGVANADGCR